MPLFSGIRRRFGRKFDDNGDLSITLPTGDKFESGSNSNGDYVKIGGLYQECWATGLDPADDRNYTWTFPVAFAEPPAVFWQLRSNAAIYGTHETADATTTQAFVQAPSANASNRFSVRAIGKPA